MNHKKTSSLGLLIVFVITAGIIFLCDFPKADAAGKGGDDLFVLEGDTASETDRLSESSARQVPAAQTEICVYVCGCVESPGVYRFGEGARVYEAIDAAGGAAKDADTDGMNLAEPLSDGERVYVPAKGEEQASAAGAAGVSLININQASAADLVALPGIGQSKANAIINYRLQHGSFSSKEELLNVPGIKEGIYDQIEALVTVN